MDVISPLELAGLVVCLLGSAFYSGSEAVLMSVGVDRAKQIIEEGGSRAKIMSFMLDKPSELLTTILVGNNIVNIWASALTTTIAARFFKSDAVGISVGITTLVILIFGEIIPKTFARSRAEKLSVATISILRTMYYMIYPIVTAMVWFIKVFLGNKGELGGRLVTKNDIEYMISKAEKERSMDSKQLDLLNSILEFPTIKVKDIMVPRTKVKSIDTSMGFEKMIETVKMDTHSRYPVCEGGLDNTIGFLHVKDLAFIRGEEKKNFSFDKVLKRPFFVYEHMKIQAVFDYMNRKKVHLALVKDENGLVVGIVTLEDIVEEILGEIQDEHDRDKARILKEYSEDDLRTGIVVEGTISLRDLYNDYDIKIPLNDNYSTLAGFILDMLGNNFPGQGQIIVWEGFSFELIKVDEYEIREIRIRDVDGEKHLYSRREAEAESSSSHNRESEGEGKSFSSDFSPAK